MIKKFILFVALGLMLLSSSGCAILGTALAAGAAYAISQAMD